MAKKKKSGVSKAQAIRDYLAKNPNAMPKATVEALAKEGVIATAQDVSVVKHQLKKAAGGQATEPMAKPKQMGKTPAGRITLPELQQAKAIAQQLGGIDEARRVLDALATLTD
jgi:hypothetical protein